MRLTRRSWVVVPLLLAAPVQARPPTLGERYVQAARELLGTPYGFGARLAGRGDAIDCQGVLFYAAERIGSCGWKSFSVYPTFTVARQELGAPVEGLAPVASSSLDLSKLQPGDTLLLVGFERNPAEGPIGKLDGEDVWVWHTGMYAGDGRWIVGDHFAGQVVETDLAEYLAAHEQYAGIYALRMSEGPKAVKCRRHAPMKLPVESQQ